MRCALQSWVYMLAGETLYSVTSNGTPIERIREASHSLLPVQQIPSSSELQPLAPLQQSLISDPLWQPGLVLIFPPIPNTP